MSLLIFLDRHLRKSLHDQYNLHILYPNCMVKTGFLSFMFIFFKKTLKIINDYLIDALTSPSEVTNIFIFSSYLRRCL